MRKEKKVTELPEDIEVVGPGQMLVDARLNMGLSQQDVADKLNFRVALVKDIEEDIFDKALPSTYNRGYLRNYAKLVNIPIDDVLSSYEMLAVAAVQGAEMQSFSKITEKQAQNNRLMWISYLILAILVGSTLVWWLQDMNVANVSPATTKAAAPETQSKEETTVNISNETVNNSLNTTASVNDTTEQASVSEQVNTDEQKLADETVSDVAQTGEQNTELSDVVAGAADTADVIEVEQAVLNNAVDEAVVPVVFTFAGDCWVNIYDATGERIAWGVKKSGYVMTISGVAPLKVTLGKPELVQINFAGQDVDMSQFNAGNIAKFNLPLES